MTNEGVGGGERSGTGTGTGAGTDADGGELPDGGPDGGRVRMGGGGFGLVKKKLKKF